jgi:8-oxo-dGTP diphosphatase
MKQDANPRPLLAVRAIIEDKEGRILILKRAPEDEYGTLWNLPGGKVDYGQTAEEALIREVLEETSLECTSCRFLFYMDGLPETEGERHYLTLFFLCACEFDADIRLNEESSAYLWIETGRISDFRFAFKTENALNRFWNSI